MVIAPETDPAVEERRLKELYSYEILGTHAEKAFDDLTSVAAALFEVPIAYISFVDTDRQWMKSSIGIEVEVVPREYSFCSHVISGKRLIEVPDARNDERFHDNPFVTGDPNIRFYLGAPLTTARGNVIGTICVVDNTPRVADRKKVEALSVLSRQVMAQLDLRRANRILLEERETFSTLFESAPVSLMLVRDGVIERCNNTGTMLTTGRTESEELTGKRLDTILPGVSDRTISTVQTALRTFAGEDIPVVVVVTEVRLGTAIFALLAITDERERREKEKILVEARMRAENATRIKDQFLSMVSHDLRSPLSGMFTMFDLLTRAPESFSYEETMQIYADMKSSTAVLLEMINQLLNIHRLQTGKIELQREPVPVRGIVEQIGLTLARQLKEKSLDLIIEMDGSLEYSVDISLFREVLFNLISNAIKFSFPDSSITVRADRTGIAVIDHGTGIVPEDIPRLFDTLQKTSRKGTLGEPGTGLGLPLVNDIVEAHNGTIRVESEPGAGTTVFVELDLTPQ